ncbi:MAG: hypothetical protein VB013_02810 [Anaerolineaceae bacterium]|nr:hypothetical protein [Anaerolineaceae bacterium]
MKTICFSQRLSIKMLLFLIFLITLTGCKKTDEAPINIFLDGGFLSKIPCGPPCFFQITPGVTSQNDTMKIVQKSPDLFKECVYSDKYSSKNESWISCAFFNLSFQDQMVKSLDYYPSSEITSQQLIDSYGLPDSISVRSTSLLPDEPFKVVMQFCYDQINTTLLFTEQEGTTYKIDSKTPVQLIVYDDIDSYDPLCGSKKKTLKWVGYGEYVLIQP